MNVAGYGSFSLLFYLIQWYWLRLFQLCCSLRSRAQRDERSRGIRTRTWNDGFGDRNDGQFHHTPMFLIITQNKPEQPVYINPRCSGMGFGNRPSSNPSDREVCRTQNIKSLFFCSLFMAFMSPAFLTEFIQLKLNAILTLKITVCMVIEWLALGALQAN